jgi:hypothetical protein
MKHGEEFGEWEAELPKELFDIDIIRTKIAAHRLCNCFEPKYEIDPVNRFVICRVCGALVEPFTALLNVARSRERMVDENKRLLKQREQIKSYKPHLVVIKKLEKEYRGDMIPCCPHCNKPFLLEQLNYWVNRKYYKVEGVE